MEHGEGDDTDSEMPNSRRETCHTVTSSTINSTWTGPRSNLGLCCERPSTDFVVGFLDL